MVIVLSLITRMHACNNKDFYQTIEITIMLSVEAQFTLLPSYTNYTHRMVFVFRWLLLSTKWFLCNLATYVDRQWQDILLVIYTYVSEPASQPALPETSGWLVLELMPTRAVQRCAIMEHGEQCVMISGELWMPVWPANNWVSLETVSVYYCCFTITDIESFV